ncbi:hypothetical protein TRFO_27424 [Tritrichomonas foetus]|uniref:Uncharacterized protein n=1 Tax=Tritrichomonas foetus TaxID=1144522 RepID=A0A1J4K0L5_9EUKA|nr:hypothetical protein TRFO_27424 [Tritrichomonas foetus]|eukprot:OHT04977.1 hypothetical protein TRFO_27424 [Tritrichomonas foetus]
MSEQSIQSRQNIPRVISYDVENRAEWPPEMQSAKIEPLDEKELMEELEENRKEDERIYHHYPDQVFMPKSNT